MRKSDRDILDVFVKNRKEGVRMLFDQYYRPLVLYAGSLIDDDTMAEDLVQEFFVRLWEDDYLKHIEEKALSSYLFSSVRNSCYTYTHKKDVLRRRVDYTAIDVAADTATVLNQGDDCYRSDAGANEESGGLRADAGYEISGCGQRVTGVSKHGENVVT